MRLVSLVLLLAPAVFGQWQPWRRLTPSAVSGEPVLARTKDGALHLVWQEGGAVLHTALEASSAGPAGVPGTILPAGSNIQLLSISRLLALPDGSLQMIFTRGAPAVLESSVSKDHGKTWESASGPQTSLKEAARVAAVADREGKPVLAFNSPPGKLSWQAGLGGGQPIETVREGPCCIPYSEIALDADSAEGWLAWRLQRAGESGLFVKAIKPASGAVQSAPGSQGAGAWSSASLSARVGAPGVYLAYCAGSPACQEIRLWNVRGGEALAIAKAPGARNIQIAAGPDGRLWVLWSNPNQSVFAVRSNKALTRFSRPYALGQPAPGAVVRALAAEGSTGPLDVVAHGAHRRVYPELELLSGPEGISALDVGDPVEGVTLEIDGKTSKTGANGIGAHEGKAASVKATHPAYAPATLPAPPRPPLRRAR